MSCGRPLNQLLRHAGLRVSELVDVRLDDLELSERKGQFQIQRNGRKHWVCRSTPMSAERSKPTRRSDSRRLIPTFYQQS